MPRTGIDVAFDFRRDTPEGKDPDIHSKTLRRYHKLLWSKPLPSGAPFGLSDSVRGHYLHHQSPVGEFSLSSDTVIPTFRWHKLIQTQLAAAELEDFRATVYTIGGMMVFPGTELMESGRPTKLVAASGVTTTVPKARSARYSCGMRHSSRSLAASVAT